VHPIRRRSAAEHPLSAYRQRRYRSRTRSLPTDVAVPRVRAWSRPAAPRSAGRGNGSSHSACRRIAQHWASRCGSSAAAFRPAARSSRFDEARPRRVSSLPSPAEAVGEAVHRHHLAEGAAGEASPVTFERGRVHRARGSTCASVPIQRRIFSGRQERRTRRRVAPGMCVRGERRGPLARSTHGCDGLPRVRRRMDAAEGRSGLVEDRPAGRPCHRVRRG